MFWVVAAVLFVPLACAGACFLLSLYFAVRMLKELRPGLSLAASFSGPLAMASERFYSPQGVVYLRQFHLWFRRFGLCFFAWGVLVLVAYTASRLL